MEVVAIDDARRVEDVPADVFQVDVMRRRLEQDLCCIPEEAQGSRQDQDRDRE